MAAETSLQRFGWRYVVARGAETVAELVAEVYDTQAMLHHRVNNFSRPLLFELRAHLETVRADLRAEGVTQIVASSDHYDAKMGRYWQLMGFRCFGQCQASGVTIHFAVMEA